MQPLKPPAFKTEAQGDLGLRSEEKGATYFYRFWQWFRDQIIQDVPENYAVCEFECRKPRCTIGNPEKCEIRLRYKAQSQ